MVIWGKENDEIYHHEWRLTEKQYLRCLDLFPQWSIFIHTSWYEDIREMLNYELLDDLSKICLSYLRFSGDSHY